MLSHFRPAVTLIAAFTIVLGVAYPLAMTGLASVIAPHAARGSLIERNSAVVGSELIGQAFTAARYLHSRPSATTGPDRQDASKMVAAPYNAANSGGSNYGPSSAALISDVKERAATFAARPAPRDAVTASASGLDPHISPATAAAQFSRIAQARGISQERVTGAIAAATEMPLLGFFGEPRVHVLRANLALDGLQP